MRSSAGHVLYIIVADNHRTTLDDASITIERLYQPGHQSASLARPEFEEQMPEPVAVKRGFRVEGLVPGRYIIIVSRQGYETERREIEIDADEQRSQIYEEFHLGRPGMLYYRNGAVRIPVELPERPRILVKLGSGIKAVDKALLAIARTHQLEIDTTPQSDLQHDRVIFRFTRAAGKAQVRRVIEAMTRSRLVDRVMPVLQSNADSVQALTGYIYARFKDELSEQDIAAIVEKQGLHIASAISGVRNGYVLRHGEQPDFDVLEACERLLETGSALYADPGFDEADATPLAPPPSGDALHPQEWHSIVARLPQAWSFLNSQNVNLTYGSADLVGAIFDFGTHSHTIGGIALPSHQDLTGNVTNGSPKVFGYYDFKQFVPNHDVTNYPSDASRRTHGSQALGIFGTSVENTLGTAGAAGNVRVFPITITAGQVPHSESILWAAGLTVNWTIPSWSDMPTGAVHPQMLTTPAPNNPLSQPVTRGADIISNSYTWTSKGNPLNSAAIDLLRNAFRYGRNGRGTLILFSGGEQIGQNDSNLVQHMQPIAAIPEVMIISASSLFQDPSYNVTANSKIRYLEQRSLYCGYGRPQDGRLIDLCAPSGSVMASDNELHQPPGSWGTVTMNYTDDGNLPANGGLVTHGGVPVLHVGGCVETTYTGIIAGNDISVVDGSGFAKGQVILIGNPTANGVYTIIAIVATNRLRLDRPVTGQTVGADLKALSLKMTELDDPAFTNDVTINIDSSAGFLVNQKIVIGDPRDSGTTSEVRTISAVTGNTLTITPKLNADHANDEPVYLLGGPPGSYGYLETTLTQNHSLGDSELHVPTTAGFAKGQALMVGRRDRPAVRMEGGWMVSNTTDPGDPLPDIVAAEGHVIISNVNSTTTITIGVALFKAQVSGIPVYGGTAINTNDFSGTSSACPLVAGVMALVLSTKMDSNQQSTLTYAEARDILRRTADKIDIMNIGFTSSHGKNQGYFSEADTIGAGKWYDRHNELIATTVGSSAVLNVIEANTTLIQPTIPGGIIIDVVDSSNIVPGHAIAIESESVMVRWKSTNGTLLVVDPLLVAHDAGKPVTSGSTTLRTNAVAGAVQIDVDNSRGFIQGQAIQIGGVTGQEVRVIESITHPNTIYLDIALDNTHTAPATVKGGRIPHYSHWYGHGRVNAEKAVKMAWSYQHSERDLIIRNNLADTGTAPSTPIDSPDIWVRNSDPLSEKGTFPTSFDYGIPGPHQTANINKPKWVGVRITNIGTKYHNLEARASVFIALTSAVVPPGQNTPFPFPSAWPIINNIGQLHSTLAAGTYFLGEKVIPEGAISPQGYIKGDDKMTLYLKWDAPVTPIAARTTLRCFVLVQITPHDGLLNGPEPDANNNLTYKEINFTEIHFKKDAIDELQRNIPVKRSGAEVTIPYRVEITDSLGLFDTLKIVIEVHRRAVSGAQEIVTYSYDTGTSAWVVTNPKPWVTFTPPVDATSAPSQPFDSEAIFTGTLKGNVEYDLIEIKATVRETLGAMRAEQLHSIVLSPAPINYSTDSEIVASSGPRFHAFAEMQNITQSEDQAFGIKSPERFRLTSGFSLRAPFISVKAFATVSGTVFIQRVRKPDGTYSSTAVNLILRPLRQSRVNFTPVKYFIYRGLKLSDFLTITGVNTTLVRPAAEASEFIAELHHQHGIRRDLFIAQYGMGAAPDLIPSGKALGWDPTGQNQTDLLDKYFYRDDPSFQLPIVRRGMGIGEFDTTGDFGFEIVLEEGETHFQLEFARRRYYEIDINFLSETGLALKRRKEEILNFVDPAAYYGMHYFMGVETDTGMKKEAALYTDIVAAFHTRNMVYVDIRNEHGYSLNYYGNYHLLGPPEGHTLRMAANPRVSTITERPFETREWPIMTLDNLTYTSDPMSSFAMAFRMADNENPVLFVESGQVNPSGKGRIIAGYFLFALGDIWTKDVGFLLPNVSASVTDATEKRFVSGVVKLHFARRPAGTIDWPDTVVKGDKYLDNVFGPVDVETFWTTNDPVRWISAQDKRFIDVQVSDHTPPFAYMAERSVAIEPDRIIYYTTAIEYLDGGNGRIIKTKRLKGGHSSRGSFVEASSLFDGLNLKVASIATPTDGTVQVPYFVKDIGSDTDPLDVLLLGISKVQQQALVTAGAALNPNHEKNIVLLDKYTPTTGTSYIRYRLGVRGLSANLVSGKYVSANASTPSPIYVYSIDGLFFSSATLGEIREVPQYETDPEEKVAEERSAEVSGFIAADGPMADLVNEFAGDIDDISSSNSSVVTLLTSTVGGGGNAILARARTAISSTFDDRPLYWARLKMAVKFKQHDYLNKSDADRIALTKLLEENSRGYDTVDFSGITSPNKRVLVIGFDPFALSPDLARSNPSGVAALKLHGATIGGSRIQSIILPVRYRDFEDGLTAGDSKGIIEEKIEQYLTGTKRADVIVVLAENGSRRFFDVERFAARGRGKQGDNENQLMLQPIGVGADWKEYYESSLPEDMVDAYDIPDPAQWVCLDQSFSYQRPNQPVVTTNPPGEGGVNDDEWDTGIVIPTDAAMLRGSGGNYLFNETFYRIARLRDKLTSTTAVGMLGIPLPENTNPKLTISEVVDKVKELITKALDEL